MNFSRHARSAAIALLGLGLLAVAAAVYFATRAPAESAAQPPASVASSSVSVANGITQVHLSVATQRESGIRTEPLMAASHRSEITAYGHVLNLQPMMDLGARHEAARAEAASAKAAVAAARAEFERSRALYADNHNVSLKSYQAAQASYQVDRAKADAAGIALQSIEAAAREQFGQTLAEWLLDEHSSEFAQLTSRREVLARITLPPGSVSMPPDAIQVQPAGGKRLPAHLVSPAAQSAPDIAGSSFIYRVAAPLATGTPLLAFVPVSSKAMQGVIVPSSAVVWYSGQPWAYLQTASSQFARRSLSQAAPTDGGFFMSGGLQAGDRVVTSGAQLLLSEEQKQPSTSTGCKDPECD